MANPNVYDKGDLVRVSVVFKNTAGTATDPTTVRFKFENPAGTATTYTYPTDSQLVKDSTGNYHVDVSASSEGKWYYRWEGTGTVEDSADGQFTVKDSNFS